MVEPCGCAFFRTLEAKAVFLFAILECPSFRHHTAGLSTTGITMRDPAEAVTNAG